MDANRLEKFENHVRVKGQKKKTKFPVSSYYHIYG